MLDWYVISNNKEEKRNQHFMGTYRGSEAISTELQLWNNRYGEFDQISQSGLLLILRFDNYEDQNLIEYINIELDGQPAEVEKTGSVIRVPIEKTISGKKNNGITEENGSNFLSVRVIVDLPNENYKKQDLKNLIIDVIEK